jgi:hypothetical protein
MNEQRRPRPASPTIMQTLEQSRADLVAGRVEDFDSYMTQLRKHVEKRAAELEQDQSDTLPDQ